MSRTYKQLSIEDELAYSQEGSPVNPTARQDSEKESTTSATCGPKCLELFKSANHIGSWAKMFADLLVGTRDWSSKRCILTWNVKATKYKRLYFQLQVKTPRTEEIESTLLPTPNSYDWNTARSKESWNKAVKTHGNALQVSLKQMAKFGLLPTPTATDYKGAYPPTSINNNPARKNLLRNAYQYTGEEYHSRDSQLNPRFAAEMMGFPPNWTESPFLSGEKKA
jgi:hypothetical protein